MVPPRKHCLFEGLAPHVRDDRRGRARRELEHGRSLLGGSGRNSVRRPVPLPRQANGHRLPVRLQWSTARSTLLSIGVPSRLPFLSTNRCSVQEISRSLFSLLRRSLCSQVGNQINDILFR